MFHFENMYLNLCIRHYKSNQKISSLHNQALSSPIAVIWQMQCCLRKIGRQRQQQSLLPTGGKSLMTASYNLLYELQTDNHHRKNAILLNAACLAIMVDCLPLLFPPILPSSGHHLPLSIPRKKTPKALLLFFDQNTKNEWEGVKATFILFPKNYE